MRWLFRLRNPPLDQTVVCRLPLNSSTIEGASPVNLTTLSTGSPSASISLAISKVRCSLPSSRPSIRPSSKAVSMEFFRSR
ncbi:MAG: hypothetical protein Q3M24_13075 [Candidatus Electrothrix aestuarii]|uniref:Uncharacterized protein n=1 Tax=Candidatus Electrothrix aestuarii TaxID=3062594 RepID=A0AAU8LQR4_9BACT|nr:hypothetical protein [Candidatus Electrothrix aestuarii]